MLTSSIVISFVVVLFLCLLGVLFSRKAVDKNWQTFFNIVWALNSLFYGFIAFLFVELINFRWS